MIAAEKLTSADLLLLPEDNRRYELIEGELYVSRQPSLEHQYTCGRLFKFLDDWHAQAGLGVMLIAPGLIFAEDDDVAPDVVWISRQRWSTAVDEKGHLRNAPELVIEVLCPGKANEHRDRQAKLKLYSRRGVQGYWVVSWMRQFVELYRRKEAPQGYAELTLAATLYAQDRLASSLLPGFSCQVADLFFTPPGAE